MAPPQPSAPVWHPRRDVLAAVLGTLAVAAAWYYLVGLFQMFNPPAAIARALTIVQWAGAGVLSFLSLLGTALQLRRAIGARKATERVAEALTRIKKEAPERNVSAIPAKELADAVKGTNVSSAHLVRLVEQRKQQMLIDEEAFRRDVGNLVVDYLQPLPRNAKRVLNRFRVNLLIADRRGLFTTEPKVTSDHIGKWLVLGERWPQLRLALSAAPEKIQLLEQHAATPRPGQTGDIFESVIAVLAPLYAGDEDLRRFMQSSPMLGGVLPRLVHYGTQRPS
jgi:hypothetical protein